MVLPTTPGMRALAWEAFRKAMRDGTMQMPFDPDQSRLMFGLDLARPGSDRTTVAYAAWRPTTRHARPDMAQMIDDIERNYPRRIVNFEAGKIVEYRLSYETDRVIL